MIMLCLMAAPDNVKEIQNGKKPEGKQHTLKLTEELRVTPNKIEEDYFVWVGKYITVDADKQGNMYVADGMNNRVVMISPEGKYVKMIGDAGEGPGEFQFLRAFRILADGSAIAFENSNFINRFNFYDASLAYKDRAFSEEKVALSDVTIAPNGKLISGNASVAKGKVELINYGIFEIPGLKMAKAIHSNEARNDFDYSKMQTPGFWLEFIPSRLQYHAQGEIGYVTFDKDNNIYTAVGKDYEITKWSPDLKPLLTIRRDYTPIPQSEEEIMAEVDQTKESLVSQLPHLESMFSKSMMEKAVVKAGFLPRKHPIYGLTTLEDGKLIVVHSVSQLTQDVIGDIFDTDGTFLGSFEHINASLLNIVFKNGKAYTIESTPDGEKHLVRYAVQLVAQ